MHPANAIRIRGRYRLYVREFLAFSRLIRESGSAEVNRASVAASDIKQLESQLHIIITIQSGCFYM